MKYGTMKKRTSRAFGKRTFLLGKDVNGVYYWLEEGSWSCDWYWSFGHVENYTNNKNPSQAKDIKCSTHWNYIFKPIYDVAHIKYEGFKINMEATTFTERERWELCELMKEFYVAEEYLEMMHGNGTNISTGSDILKSRAEENKAEYLRLKKIIGEIIDRVEEILTPKAKGDK